MATKYFDITGADLTANAYDLTYTDIDSDSIKIWINGVYQHQGAGKDYTFSGSTVTFLHDIFSSQLISGQYVTGYSSDSDVDYCSLQDVYDELDGKTSTDISEDRVTNAIQRAEGLIDLRTGTSFKINTETDEIHSMNRYNADISPEKLDLGYNLPQRMDRWGFINNHVKVKKTPLISVTSLSKNSASAVNADSWTALTEQSGSGGDFIVMNKDAGIIDFVNNYPSFGERSWKITYTWGHNPDSTDRDIIARIRVVQRLTIVLASKMVLSGKSSGSIFDSTRDIRIGTIEIKGAGTSTRQHMTEMQEEIEDLWNSLGDLGIEVI